MHLRKTHQFQLRHLSRQLFPHMSISHTDSINNWTLWVQEAGGDGSVIQLTVSSRTLPTIDDFKKSIIEKYKLNVRHLDEIVVKSSNEGAVLGHDVSICDISTGSNADAPILFTRKSENAQSNAGVHQEEDLPTCRICRETAAESTKKMFRPCKCSGSLAFVHVDCLNMWRHTSESAYYACPICKYNYNIERSTLAVWFMTDTANYIFVFILVVTLSLFIGVIVLGINHVTSKYNYDFVTVIIKDMLGIVRDNCNAASNRTTRLLNAGVKSRAQKSLYYILDEYVMNGADWLKVTYYNCNEASIFLVNALLLGFVALGLSGFLLNAHDEVIRMYEMIRMQVNPYDVLVGQLGIHLFIMFYPVVTLLSVSDNRIRLILGFCVFCQLVLQLCLRKSKEYAVYIGEIILEAHT